MSKAHARLSPSSCDRWSTCTASVALIEELRDAGKIPERSSSIFSAEGTVAHEVREYCLELGFEPHHFTGRKYSADGFDFVIDDAMAEHLQRGIDWIWQHTSAPHVEIRVDLSAWLPGQFGTCDTAWIERDLLSGELTLVVNDFKYGAGEPVDAVGTKQLRLYALGVWDFLGRPKVDNVLLIIDQPRAGGLKDWEISLSDLVSFGEEIKEIYRKIISGDVEFAPGNKACRWCEAKAAEGGCPARNKWLLDMIVDEFDDLEGDEPILRDRITITPERRWHIVKHAADIRAWLAALHEDSLRVAVDGNPDPGSKAIEGDEGDRQFTDIAEAERLLAAALGDKAYKPRQIIGFTDIDKLVKPGKRKPGHPETWDELQKLVRRPAGKPKLVPEYHPKPALRPLADEFDDLD